MSSELYTKRRDSALELQDPRKAEAYALVEIARRMEDVRQKEFDRANVVEVLQLNWKLWTIFQSELNNPDNPMPEAIKLNMIQLSNFVDKHTMALIKDPTLQGMVVLININRQIGSGLMGEQGGQEAGPQASDPQEASNDTSETTETTETTEIIEITGTTETTETSSASSTPSETAVVKKPLFRTKKVGG